MNSDTMTGQWKQLKGSAKEKWGKLTDDDFKVIDGKVDQLVGKIQERYGVGRDEDQKQVDAWYASANKNAADREAASRENQSNYQQRKAS